MDKDKSLQHIANSFTTAYKIRELMKPETSESRDISVHKDRYSMISEMLQVIYEYSPDTYKKSMGNTLNKSMAYTETYRNLMQMKKTPEMQTADSRNIINVLNTVKPALGQKEARLIEKILILFNVLGS